MRTEEVGRSGRNNPEAKCCVVIGRDEKEKLSARKVIQFALAKEAKVSSKVPTASPSDALSCLDWYYLLHFEELQIESASQTFYKGEDIVYIFDILHGDIRRFWCEKKHMARQ